MTQRFHRPFVAALAAAVIFGAANGCSVRRVAVNRLADALAGSGTTFASDNDPDLVRDALPFSLKLMESLLAESPEHDRLLLATCSAFTQYGYAFVHQDADALESADFAGAEALRGRARRLYLRARDYGLRALEVRYPGVRTALSEQPRQAVARVRREDVPALYWTAAAWAAAITLGKDDPGLLSEIPRMEALIERALELDEAWGLGSLHEFFIAYEMSRTGVAGDPAARAEKHFRRAAELAGNRLASPYVTYAESVCVETQDLTRFEAELHRALGVDPDAHPDFRLVNLVMQKRARWLLSRKEDLFLTAEPPASP